MFSKGQLVFALIFFLAFVAVMVWAYRKDKSTNRSFFSGSYKVLLFVLFIFFALYGIVKMKHLFMD